MVHLARAGRVADAAQRFGLVLMVGLLLAAFWIALGSFAWVQHGRLVQQASRDVRLVNKAVANHAAGLFRAVEMDLRTLDLWLQAHPGADPLTDPHFTALVGEMHRASRGLFELHLVDGAGAWSSLAARRGTGDAPVGRREKLPLEPAPEAAPFAPRIGAPVRSDSTGLWSIPVTWHLSRPAGRFVSASCAVRLDRLLEIHDTLRYKPSGTISLVRHDGVLLSRVPHDPRLLGRDVRSVQHFNDDIERHPDGAFSSRGLMTDGIARFGTYERLDDVPVTVAVARGADDLLDPFHARLGAAVATGVLLTVAVGAFTAFLHRSQRALRVARVDLERLATEDALTGAFNRRAFFEIAEREFLRARRFERPMTLLALDIDHFKAINDTRGHAVGDRVLAECVDRWQAVLRGQDVLGRLGGEEFGVLLPETAEPVARAVAERLRAALAEPPMPDGTRVTVSIGLASVDATDPAWSATLERADRSLYGAKAAGRDRVEVAAPPPSP